jgi:uncharacterized membrane protein
VPDDPANLLEERLTHLEERVAAIARYVGLDPQPAVRAAATPPAATDASARSRSAPPPAAPAAPGPKIDVEGFFSGRVLLGAGALTLLLGIGFFIKYAFDNGWIGPTGRVAIGLLAGIATIAVGERFRRGEQRVFAHAMTGLGGAILYLSLWGAGNAFHLVPVAVSFGAMIVVTAALVALALRRESQITAAFALLGGFITPLLNQTATPEVFNLLLYLAVLDSAFVFLPLNRRWPAIRAASYAFTQLYFLTAIRADPLPSLSLALSFATVFFVLFMIAPLRKALAARDLEPDELVLVVVAASAFYFALHLELFAAHRHWLTGAVVALAAFFLAVARTARSHDRTVFAALALAAITGGVAITFTGSVVAILWAVEGGALSWIGLTRRQPAIRGFGFVALGLALLTPLAYTPQSGPHFANERFATFAILAASFFAAHYAHARNAAGVFEYEKFLYVATEPLAHLAALYAVSCELYDVTNGNELSLTLFWVAYAAALFAWGAWRHSAFTRWEGFALLSFALIKAFVVDLSEVNPGVRIVSFLALGSVLLVISYVSQRYAKRTG